MAHCTVNLGAVTVSLLGARGQNSLRIHKLVYGCSENIQLTLTSPDNLNTTQHTSTTETPLQRYNQHPILSIHSSLLKALLSAYSQSPSGFWLSVIKGISRLSLMCKVFDLIWRLRMIVYVADREGSSHICHMDHVNGRKCWLESIKWHFTRQSTSLTFTLGNDNKTGER